MAHIRTPAVAGKFYPENATELSIVVRTLLQQFRADSPAARAIIAPHAGYLYSGAIAAISYNSISIENRQTISRVLILSPNHRAPLQGIALPTQTHFATPLGVIPLDIDTISQLATHHHVAYLDALHQDEHGLEVQLPFIQAVVPHARIIPLIIGQSDTEWLCDVLFPFWQDPQSLIIVSSDLSHFHDYASAKQIDNETSQLIEQLRQTEITPQRACGCYAIRALIQLASTSNAHIKTLQLGNSGDFAGSKDRVVGYGSYVVY